MYVSRLRVSGILGFHGGRSVDLTFTRPDGSHAGWTVLAGRNGSGKTSLLRVLASTLVEPAAFSALVPESSGWNSDKDVRGEVETDLMASSLDATSDTASPSGRPESWSTQVVISLPSREGRVSERSVAASWYSERAGKYHRFTESLLPEDMFAAGYGPFRRLAGGTAESQRIASSPEAGRFVTLFHEEASLAEGVSWLIGLHLRQLESRPGARELLDTVLKLLADGLLPDGFRVERVDSDGLWVTRGGRTFPMREMSDGYRTVTALVLDLVRQLGRAHGTLSISRPAGPPAVEVPGVVLIDEIDAHLHVSWQQRIGEWMKTHFPLIQFIVTTHSPYICQAADPGGLIRLAAPDEDLPPRVVDEDLYQRIVYGSGDDAALSELFGLDSPYSPKAVTLRHELMGLESRVLSGDADAAEVDRYRQISDMLTSSLNARVDEVAARLAHGE